MKRGNEIVSTNKIRRHERDERFHLSIQSIVMDIIMREMKDGTEYRTIAILSPFHGDGKSEIAQQLSREFAATGARTLLLSLEARSDLLKPDPLKSMRQPEEAAMKTDINFLDYLCLDEVGSAGELLSDRNTLASLLSVLKGKYRRILIDTASLEEDLSGFVAASAADGAYFVLHTANSRSRKPELFYKRLRGIGVNVLGVIFNCVDARLIRRIQKAGREDHG